EEFVELLSLAQVLPGPNVCNLALMIGDRFFGLRGAFAALAGMMLLPLVIVIGLTALYVHWSGHPMVAGALRGMAAVSAGLIVGSALRLMPALRRNPMGLPMCIALAVATFAGIALLRWPLIWVLAVLGAVGWGHAWRRIRAQERRGGDA
ncbi:MAG TPA: chromate transporter, partial [Burkholderiaceae bacterium]|nr:chromate transporter [Burkholderiaceae bacterium]